MTQPAIEVRGLGKRYRLGVAEERAAGVRSLGGRLLAPFRYLRRSLSQASEAETLWALRDLDLDLQPGEVLGIVGSNGAGKTTLLKILARITEPTTGQALVRGRLGCLLQVGTGFHPELSGRENIYLNGAIMGMKKAEVDAKFEEIVEFSGVARFIDTPVKFYSSGMFVRLAFAVAAHLEPEILIVDEVLAVGDAAFQRKCLGKMGSVASEGRTILFVSHNLEAVTNLCSRAIWLNQGRLVDDGAPDDIVRKYYQASMEKAQSTPLDQVTDRSGNGALRFTGFKLRTPEGRELETTATGDTVDFVFDYIAPKGEPLNNVSVWFWVNSQMGQRLMQMESVIVGQDFLSLPPRGCLVCRVPRLRLAPGAYQLGVTATVQGERADRIHDAALLEVSSGDFYGTGKLPPGVFVDEYDWRAEPAPPRGLPSGSDGA
ncbi:MAG: ABC transporter ATP-binding protein [Desulfarculus sp.]|nr:ABC transporter ATP-binding protein [Desulfarculus sp.]